MAAVARRRRRNVGGALRQCIDGCICSAVTVRADQSKPRRRVRHRRRFKQGRVFVMTLVALHRAHRYMG
jgi:hypothetical protein